MKNKLNILNTNIFEKNKIISGVTLANKELFPKYGFSISKGDIYTEDDINKFKQYLADYLEIEIDCLKTQKQVHSDKIGTIEKDSGIFETDAMITNVKGLILGISIADCGGILIYDPINKVVAAVHSGWKGTFQKILIKVVDKLKIEYNTDPLNLQIYLAPSACGDCYEVGEEFKAYFPESIYMQNNKLYFNNKAELIKQILSCGCSEENIEKSSICSIEDLNCHSYRRDKSHSGRMCAFIGML